MTFNKKSEFAGSTAKLRGLQVGQTALIQCEPCRASQMRVGTIVAQFGKTRGNGWKRFATSQHEFGIAITREADAQMSAHDDLGTSGLNIEDGIPIPPVNRAHATIMTPLTALFRSMMPGQSVFIPDAMAKGSTLTTTIWRLNNKPCGEEYTQRRDEGGHRVWRIK